jgi:O-antigen ligase
VARSVLALAIVVSAFGVLNHKIWELVGRTPILFFDLTLMLPAVVLGSIYWWKGRSYASRWPVVLCIGLVWISLIYPGNLERLRGFLIAALVTLPLPLAALVVEKRAWTFCAKVYVWANAAMMLIALWFESRVENSFLQVLGRFGFLVRADGSGHTGNPNQVGGQLAFAAVVAFILYLKSSEERSETTSSKFPDVYLILMVFLSVGCMLTASRGAFASWLPAMGLLFVLGTGNLPMSRLRDLVALSSAGLLVVIGIMVASETTPWGRLQERLGNRRELGSFSNRTDIWLGAVKAWQSHPDFVWRGTGIGMADDVLGDFSPMPEESEEGVLRKNCHNAAVEWMLSLGLIGLVAASCLAGSMAYQTIRLDARDRNVGRSAMIICVIVFAMTAVSYRHKCWPATAALVLAMLTEPAVRRREDDPASVSENASRPALAGCHFNKSRETVRSAAIECQDRPARVDQREGANDRDV